MSRRIKTKIDEQKIIKKIMAENGSEKIIYRGEFIACHMDKNFCWKAWKVCQIKCKAQCKSFYDYVEYLEMPILRKRF